MNLEILCSYMEEFDISELKSFLGDKLSDLLIEWLPADQPTFTHANYAKMISSLHGVRILENKDFRNRLLRSFDIKTLNSFKEIFGEKSNSYSSEKIIELVSSTTWKNNAINKHLLSILNISESIFEKKIDNRDAVEKVIATERFYELLDYQFAIKQKVLSYLCSDNELSKMIIRMPTGTGKTKTAMHTLIHHYIFNQNKKGLIVWLAHTKELLNQAYDTFANVWRHIGQDEVISYKMWDKFDLPESDELFNGFLFSSIQKLSIAKKGNPLLFQKICKSCVLVVIDEAHKASATDTKDTINELMSKPAGVCDRSLIGLTATPGRTASSEENVVFSNMFDGKIIEIDTKLLNDLNLSKTEADNMVPEKDIIKYFQDRKILAKIVREKIEYDGLSPDDIKELKLHLTANGYKDFSQKFLERVSYNKSRNQKILNRLIQLSSNEIPTIVFACSVEHGKMLSAALTLQGIENGHVFGDMDNAERSITIKRFKDRDDNLNILINFEVLTTGFDATNIKCVFITRPTNSVVLYSQMLGRGLRGPKMGGNAECLLIDIDDNLNKFTSESAAFNSFDEYWK